VIDFITVALSIFAVASFGVLLTGNSDNDPR